MNPSLSLLLSGKIKTMKSVKRITLSIVAALLTLHVVAQEVKDSVPEKFVFSTLASVPASCVKDQYASGTCWSFATTSFLESELLRMTGDTFDLSEMYFVRNAYLTKAMRYVRLHGTANFGEGGQAHDVLNVIRASGMMTEKAYSGLANGQTKPAHAELESVLSAMVGALAKNPAGKLSPEWIKALSGVLDVYLGPLPQTSGYKNQTAAEFGKQISPDDYVEITSYTHHPFYSSFSLEVPDNWAGDQYYNVPLDDLISIMENALKAGYSVAWDGDVSDKGFSHQKGVALVPETSLDHMTATERSKWEKIPEKDLKLQLYQFDKPVPEKDVTAEMRQTAFDNFSATDDHLMHITGLVKDQNGNLYFRTKNSWSAESNAFGGYLNLSVPYVKMNTIAILVHRDAIPRDIRKKAGIR
jgi:bleomycin hydrolase